jgi:glyoxylase-like metal-dependent hydrolase (beta-lactamase superfamily II)
MSNAMQISPHLWQLKMGMVNAYLLETSGGLVLVDAGWPNKADAIFKAVQESGHKPTDIRHLVLTHGHIDHAGSAAEVLRRTGARSYAHAADLELISKGNAERPGTTVTPGMIPAIVLNEDRALARQSLLRVAGYPFERAVFGHGSLLDKQANQILKERFSDTKLR